jgi:hypothetical protein
MQHRTTKRNVEEVLQVLSMLHLQHNRFSRQKEKYPS